MPPPSLANRFVTAARSLLGLQLFVSVLGIALAAWTLAVTGEVVRERDGLRERVIQLETELAARGVIVPEAPTMVTAAEDSAAIYPGAVAALATRRDEQGLPAFLTEMLAPPPPLAVVVLHVRAENVDVARKVADVLARTQSARVLINTLSERSARPPGYVYYDGRQNRAAAQFVAHFHDAARTAGAAAWSAQLRGEALPAEGEYTADRVDLVLPPLPEASPTPVATVPTTPPPNL
ncbi:MAG: hypothetical protein K2P58_02325 [Hyphomonadaceae bacterium]|nr:hypothetical protein [Hyphomonadaceae bacterium]